MAAVEVRYSGQDVEVQSAAESVEVQTRQFALDVASVVMVGGIPYTGEYEARAMFERQVFPTAQKTMREDFAVNAINYTEAPNDSGITLTIGG